MTIKWRNQIKEFLNWHYLCPLYITKWARILENQKPFGVTLFRRILETLSIVNFSFSLCVEMREKLVMVCRMFSLMCYGCRARRQTDARSADSARTPLLHKPFLLYLDRHSALVRSQRTKRIQSLLDWLVVLRI